MKKNKYLPEQLIEHCNTVTDIICTKCRDTDMTYASEYVACDDFFDKGWRATENHTYCPNCAKKYLKQTQ
jgi:hypothetical protein